MDSYRKNDSIMSEEGEIWENLCSRRRNWPTVWRSRTELTDSLKVKDGTDRQSAGQGRNWPTVWRSRTELTDSLKVKDGTDWKSQGSSAYVDGNDQPYQGQVFM
jgi:hypothetical protein